MKKNLATDYPEIYRDLSNLYPKLEDLFFSFRGYENRNFPEMIKDYLEDSFGVDNNHLKETIVELNKLIAEDWDEEYISDITLRLGMNVEIEDNHFEPTSHTYKEWIVDLRDILQKEYDKRINEGK